MDTSKFLGKFRDATRDHLRRMDALLVRLEQEPGRTEDASELMREIHTLKGESRMMGFADMATIAHVVEDVLREQEQRRFRDLPSVGDAIFRAFDAVERLLREKLGEGPAGVSVDAECAALRALLEQPPPAVAEPLPATQAPAAPAAAPREPELPDLPPVDPSADGSDEEGLGDLGLDADDEAGGPEDDEEAGPPEGAGSIEDAFGVPQGVAQEIGAGGLAAPPGERAVALGGGPSKFLARFRDAARGRLARMRDGVTAWDARPGFAAGAADLAGEADALAVEARAMGYEDVADLARALHARLASLAAERLDPAPWRRAIGAAIEGLGRLVAEKLGGPPAAMDLVAVRTELAAAPIETAELPAVDPFAGDEPPPPPPGATPRAAASVAPPPAGGSATASATARPERAPDAAPRSDETIRVAPERLDEIAALASDLYFQSARAEDRMRRIRGLIEIAGRQARSTATLRQALAGGRAAAALELHDEVADVARTLRRGLQDMLRSERDDALRAGHAVLALRESVRDLQMLPVSTLFDLHPRLVRDLARQLGRQARLVVRGGDVQLDRRVLEGLRDPLLHLLRNAVDHGIEPPAERLEAGKPALGTIVVEARAEGGHVTVEISDDGRGMDPAALRRAAVEKGVLRQQEADALTDEEAIELIFAPGFSSRAEVSDVSGRGIGMDVVRDRVLRLDGRVAIASEPGRGTRMTLRLPLALSMTRVMLVRAGGFLLALPSALVQDVMRLPEHEVRRVEGYEAIPWQGTILPLASLARLLEREPAPRRAGRRTVAVVALEEHLVGLDVDDLDGEREVVVRPLDPVIGPHPHVSGATLLGSGQVVVVLNAAELVASTLGISPVRLQPASGPIAAAAPARRARRLLVVDDSIIVRDMMKGVLEAAGFVVTLAVDGADGLEKQLADAHDLVITDVEMPRMDGFELTRTLKRHAGHEDVPVIVVTTLDSDESRQRGLDAGASAYLVKNLLDMSQLVSTIERLVA